jgi:hypothetical protein
VAKNNPNLKNSEPPTNRQFLDWSISSYSFDPKIFSACQLRFRHLEARDERLCAIGEADAVHAVS